MNSKRKALKPIEILEDRAMSLSIRHVYASSCMKFTGRILIGLLLVTSSLQAAERWPPIAIEQYRSQANEAAGLYQELREKARFRRPTELSKTYHESGQYLGYGELKHFRTGGAYAIGCRWLGAYPLWRYVPLQSGYSLTAGACGIQSDWRADSNVWDGC